MNRQRVRPPLFRGDDGKRVSPAEEKLIRQKLARRREAEHRTRTAKFMGACVVCATKDLSAPPFYTQHPGQCPATKKKDTTPCVS